MYTDKCIKSNIYNIFNIKTLKTQLIWPSLELRNFSVRVERSSDWAKHYTVSGELIELQIQIRRLLNIRPHHSYKTPVVEDFQSLSSNAIIWHEQSELLTDVFNG